MPHPTSTPSPEPADGRVIKKLQPSDPGARRWAKTYGDQLICVRYRVDAQRQRRQTTVELVVAEGPTLASLPVGVSVAWVETELRDKIKQHGGKWDASTRLWMMRFDTARQLGLMDRILSMPKRE